MDCTDCESVLLDLCYGELPPAHEREVRAHIHECPTCRKALSRLEAGQALARHLPDEAPSPELTDKILRAAQSHLRQRGTPLERFQGFLEWFARIAMTRQVAMATMSLLIVFVGLWSIPELTHRRDARSVTVEAPPPGEAGPSAREAASTASPEASAPVSESVEPVADARASRVRRQDGAYAGAPRKGAVEATAKRAERSRSSSLDKQVLAERPKAKSEAKAEGHSGGGQREFAKAPPAAAKPTAAADRLEALAEESTASGAVEAEKDDKRALGNASGDLVARRPAAPAASMADQFSGVSQSRSAAAASLEDVYAAGVERYRSEDYTAAAQLFARMLESSAPSAQRAAALLYLARSERALGRCDRAIRAYETLVRSYGSAQQSSIALSEGIACYDQVGDAAGAQRLLEHATSVPSLSAQATQRLHDRSSVKPAEPAAPAGAAQPKP
jgi:tetratricopeptide (TPR) repeat protein